MGVEHKQKAAAERREQISRLIAERASTGESWRSVAERTGIKYSTLTGWVWRLRREARSASMLPDARAAFIEVVSTETSNQSGTFELVLRGDRRLRVDASFDEPTLTRLVRILEAC